MKKKQRQAEILAARLEQIEMLRDWHIELANQQNAEVEAVNQLFQTLTNNKFYITEDFKTNGLPKLLKQFGLAIVLESLLEGSQSYGDATKALDKLGGICACKSDPVLARRVHILNRMRKRFWKFKRDEANEILSFGYDTGGEAFYDDAEALIGRLRGQWWEVKNSFWALTDRYANAHS